MFYGAVYGIEMGIALLGRYVKTQEKINLNVSILLVCVNIQVETLQGRMDTVVTIGLGKEHIMRIVVSPRKMEREGLFLKYV